MPYNANTIKAAISNNKNASRIFFSYTPESNNAFNVYFYNEDNEETNERLKEDVVFLVDIQKTVSPPPGFKPGIYFEGNDKYIRLDRILKNNMNSPVFTLDIIGGSKRIKSKKVSRRRPRKTSKRKN